MYAVDRIYNHYYAAMTGRMQFTNPDPRSGDGSLDILNLKAADTGTYQCKVKKAPGVQSQKIQLTVLGKTMLFLNFQWHFLCVYSILSMMSKIKISVGQNHTESMLMHPLLMLWEGWTSFCSGG